MLWLRGFLSYPASEPKSFMLRLFLESLYGNQYGHPIDCFLRMAYVLSHIVGSWRTTLIKATIMVVPSYPQKHINKAGFLYVWRANLDGNAGCNKLDMVNLASHPVHHRLKEAQPWTYGQSAILAACPVF